MCAPNEAVEKPADTAAANGMIDAPESFEQSAPRGQSGNIDSSSCNSPSSHHPHFCSSVTLNLLDVVHEAEQLPLRVHFALATQRESIQALRVSEITEHRLDYSKASPVLIATPIAQLRPLFRRMPAAVRSLSLYSLTGSPIPAVHAAIPAIESAASAYSTDLHEAQRHSSAACVLARRLHEFVGH